MAKSLPKVADSVGGTGAATAGGANNPRPMRAVGNRILELSDFDNIHPDLASGCRDEDYQAGGPRDRTYAITGALGTTTLGYTTSRLSVSRLRAAALKFFPQPHSR